MASRSLDRLLARLDGAKRRFGPGEAEKTERLLAALERRKISDAGSLVRLHEALLFLRAYPGSPGILRCVERLLGAFFGRMSQLGPGDAGVDAENPEISGIAGTECSAILSYEVVRRLAELHPREIEIDWDRYEIGDRLAGTWRLILPLLEEDSLVEAHVPYLEWLRAARARREAELSWLIRRLDSLPIEAKEREGLWNALELPMRWRLGDSPASRTLMCRPVRRVFYHDGPLIARSEVSLAEELASPPLPVEKLSAAEGRAVLDMALETSAVRYRELHGFTYGDPARLYRARAGRGVEVFVGGVPPERRLPLRAYHAALIFKNGVPVGYFETLTLFERMEVGFNVYYTFREGESAWLFARLLRLFRQLLGVSCFSIDPYQIGHENKEAIDSGAFWFYRKLGFRPVLAEVQALLEEEERKLRRDPAYRTPPQILRRLAAGHLVYEMPGTRQGDWDRFHVRDVGIAVARQMAEQFNSDAAKMRAATAAALARALGAPAGSGAAFKTFAQVLSLVPDLDRWSARDKRLLGEVIRAKDAAEETGYVRLMQRHARLREAILALGSVRPPA